MQQNISIVVAMNKDNVIGVDNKLPWHIPEDLKHFKELTINKPVIMGRKTFDSIGRPLPSRHNIVITRNKILIEGVTVVPSLDDAILLCKDVPEICIIGGGEIFKQSLDLANKLHITIVDVEVKNPTVFFPEIDHTDWELLRERNLISNDGIKCSFKDYRRIKN